VFVCVTISVCVLISPHPPFKMRFVIAVVVSLALAGCGDKSVPTAAPKKVSEETITTKIKESVGLVEVVASTTTEAPTTVSRRAEVPVEDGPWRFEEPRVRVADSPRHDRQPEKEKKSLPFVRPIIASTYLGENKVISRPAVVADTTSGLSSKSSLSLDSQLMRLIHRLNGDSCSKTVPSPVREKRASPFRPIGMDPMLKFSLDVARCELEAQTANLRGSNLDCTPDDRVSFGGIGAHGLGALLGSGAFGRTYKVQNQDAVVKVIYDPGMTVCREKIGIEVLDGLEGFAPKLVPITGGISSRCEKKLVAMDLVGDALWSEVVTRFDAGFYIRFARLLEAVKTMHDKGFIHMDLKGDNIRVRTADPEFIGLIDFGFLRPHVDPVTGKTDDRANRRWDMERLSMMFRQVLGPQPGWAVEFMMEMAALRASERPDYEKWIARCREEARAFGRSV